MDPEQEIKKLKQDLKFFKETGDTMRINLIQSRLDVLSLASYAEKGKDLFVKVKLKRLKRACSGKLSEI